MATWAQTFYQRSQFIHDGAFRRPSRAAKLVGEFFELGARGGFALVGGDEVRPDRKQVFVPKASKSRVKKRPKSAALSFLISSGSVTSGGMGA